jgi:acyl-CoA dehydrogenase
MVELGWTAIPFAEADGGAGLGLAEVAVLFEALGRGLVPEPFLSTVMLGGGAIALAGSEPQKRELLPDIIAGSQLSTLAFQEHGSRYELSRVSTRAEPSAGRYRLSGEKIQVMDGQAADLFVVSARTSGGEAERSGVTLFLVRSEMRGVSVTAQQRIDSRGAALVSFDGVELDEASVIGGVGEGAPLLERVIDRASVALSAEMLGAMSAALEHTLEYLKNRVQFGVAIGSFQALKHRAARMFIEVELARSLVMAAARASDDGLPEAKLLVSAAKARCSDALMLVANEAIQMHGGIGMTDEHDIGFFLKRARVAELTFGDAAFHRQRFAELSGF